MSNRGMHLPKSTGPHFLESELETFCLFIVNKSGAWMRQSGEMCFHAKCYTSIRHWRLNRNRTIICKQCLPSWSTLSDLLSKLQFTHIITRPFMIIMIFLYYFLFCFARFQVQGERQVFGGSASDRCNHLFPQWSLVSAIANRSFGAGSITRAFNWPCNFSRRFLWYA